MIISRFARHLMLRASELIISEVLLGVKPFTGFMNVQIAFESQTDQIRFYLLMPDRCFTPTIDKRY